MNKQGKKCQFLQKLSIQSIQWTSTVQIISAQLTEVQTTFYTPKESWLGLKSVEKSTQKQHPKIQDNKIGLHFLLLPHSHPAYTPFLKGKLLKENTVTHHDDTKVLFLTQFFLYTVWKHTTWRGLLDKEFFWIENDDSKCQEKRLGGRTKCMENMEEILAKIFSFHFSF